MLVYIYVNGQRVTGYSEKEELNTIPYEVDQNFINNPFKYIYYNGKLAIDDTKERLMNAKKDNLAHQSFLDDTDWKVVRHRDQVELGIETSLTNDEFIELLNQRNEARTSIINK